MNLLSKKHQSHLKSLNINLTSYQLECIQKIQSSQHSFLIGEPGSGKTVSYIISLLQSCSSGYQIPNQYSPISSLFKQNFPISDSNPCHGGLIILPSYEKLYKVYKSFRQIAPSLKVLRANSKLTSTTATYMQLDTIADINKMNIDGLKNIARNSEWPLVDILLATPKTLFDLVHLQINLEVPLVNPNLIVIDQIFSILSKKKFIWDLAKGLEGITSLTDKKFVLTSDITSDTKNLSDICSSFKDLEIVKTSNVGKVPKNLEVKGVHFYSESLKIDVLMKLINDNPGNKILVFCLNISQCRSISERCKRAGISSIISHSAIETDTRLGSYFERKFDEKVLICNEIIATSFEVHADLLIFFNTPEHLESLAHITGIVCQSGKPVKSIFLLNEYYSQFLHLLQPGQEWSSISALFKSKMIINSFGV